MAEGGNVREICEGCGLSTRTFYNNFRDRHDFVRWMYTSHYERVLRERAALEGIGDSIQACPYFEWENAFQMPVLSF